MQHTQDSRFTSDIKKKTVNYILKKYCFYLLPKFKAKRPL